MMLTEPKLDTLIDGWRQQVASPELLATQQQLLRALAQGAPWMGGRLPFSFQPSPYRVRVKESSFFAASALECLQLPVLLGEAVEVESICPSNGSTIRLTVTGLGVTSHDPAGCVMSLAVPSLTRFFSSPETAALWLVAYPEAVILRLDQAWQLAIDLTTHQQRPDGATATTFID